MPARPRPGVADQPGDPGPVQHGLGVQGVRRLVGAAHRADRAPTVRSTTAARTRRESIDEDVCATGHQVRVAQLVLPASTARAATARINMQLVARRLERRVLLPPRRARSSPRPGTNHELLQNEVRNFGFGAETGIDLPYEFDGRLPDHETKADLVESGVLAEGEEPRVLLGDVINLAIGQGLLAATPIQLAVGYGAFANGGYVMQPRVVEAIYEPNTPTSPTQPGFVDLARAVAARELRARRHADPDGRSPSRSSTASARTSPARARRPNSTTAEELFNVNWSEPAAPPIAGKTGTAQGRFSYPWNDSSVFAAFSLDSDRPWTVVSYLEKAGFGSLGCGAGRQVHVPGAGRGDRPRPRRHLRAARPRQRDGGPAAAAGSTTCRAWRAANAHTIYPGPVDHRPPCRLTRGCRRSSSPQAGLRARQHPLQPGGAEPQRRLDVDVRPGGADGRSAASSSTRPAGPAATTPSTTRPARWCSPSPPRSCSSS